MPTVKDASVLGETPMFVGPVAINETPSAEAVRRICLTGLVILLRYKTELLSRSLLLCGTN